MSPAGAERLEWVLWTTLVLGTSFFVNQYVPDPYMVGKNILTCRMKFSMRRNSPAIANDTWIGIRR